MDTQGIDQMLSVLRATSAAAGGRVGEARPAAGGARVGETQAAAAPAVDFAQVLENSIAQVSQTQQQAQGMAANLAAGNGGDLHEVMIALQKANVSFQEMVQVRNRLVTAYQDVMNMQL